jgi:hypothetical protein
MKPEMKKKGILCSEKIIIQLPLKKAPVTPLFSQSHVKDLRNTEEKKFPECSGKSL